MNFLNVYCVFSLYLAIILVFWFLFHKWQNFITWKFKVIPTKKKFNQIQNIPISYYFTVSLLYRAIGRGVKEEFGFTSILFILLSSRKRN